MRVVCRVRRRPTHNGAPVLRVTVPSGTTATFAAPGIAPKKLTAGDHEFKN